MKPTDLEDMSIGIGIDGCIASCVGKEWVPKVALVGAGMRSNLYIEVYGRISCALRYVKLNVPSGLDIINHLYQKYISRHYEMKNMTVPEETSRVERPMWNKTHLYVPLTTYMDTLKWLLLFKWNIPNVSPCAIGKCTYHFTYHVFRCKIVGMALWRRRYLARRVSKFNMYSILIRVNIWWLHASVSIISHW